MNPSESLLDSEGPGAPPRANGELLFDAPWQSRVFGLTMVLHQSGTFEWDEFRERLIVAIARAEEQEGFHYYECWLQALQGLLDAKGICLGGDVEARVSELAARPQGHDH